MNAIKGAYIELDLLPSELSGLVLQGGYATVRQLVIGESTDKSSSVGFVNVSALSDNPGGEEVGLCVMLVGKDRADEVLWACSLIGTHNGTETQELHESLLVASHIIGKTQTVALRMCGSKFPDGFRKVNPAVPRTAPIVQTDDLIQGNTDVDVQASALPRLVLRSDLATVRQLAIQEIPPDNSPPSVALINVSALSENPNGGVIGICVMLVGKDSAGNILWGCCLMGQHQGTESQAMSESLLVAPQILGKTSTIAVRVYGFSKGRSALKGDIHVY